MKLIRALESFIAHAKLGKVFQKLLMMILKSLLNGRNLS
jgi:hypothetical protein